MLLEAHSCAGPRAPKKLAARCRAPRAPCCDKPVDALPHRVTRRSKLLLIERGWPARPARSCIGRFTERIQALAANQDPPVRHAWKGINLKEVLSITHRGLASNRLYEAEHILGAVVGLTHQ
jgi:hypothetical protein